MESTRFSSKNVIEENVKRIKYLKGQLINNVDEGCKGLIKVISGQIRVYILSKEGREVMLYRLFANDYCIMSASCVLDSINFEVFIEAF